MVKIFSSHDYLYFIPLYLDFDNIMHVMNKMGCCLPFFMFSRAVSLTLTLHIFSYRFKTYCRNFI